MIAWCSKPIIKGDHLTLVLAQSHDDVIKWKHFPRYWPFVRGIRRSPVNSSQKGQWRGALMFSLICVWINGWVNNGETGDLRRYHAQHDVTVMLIEPRMYAETRSTSVFNVFSLEFHQTALHIESYRTRVHSVQTLLNLINQTSSNIVACTWVRDHGGDID